MRVPLHHITLKFVVLYMFRNYFFVQHSKIYNFYCRWTLYTKNIDVFRIKFYISYFYWLRILNLCISLVCNPLVPYIYLVFIRRWNKIISTLWYPKNVFNVTFNIDKIYHHDPLLKISILENFVAHHKRRRIHWWFQRRPNHFRTCSMRVHLRILWSWRLLYVFRWFFCIKTSIIYQCWTQWFW